MLSNNLHYDSTNRVAFISIFLWSPESFQLETFDEGTKAFIDVCTTFTNFMLRLFVAYEIEISTEFDLCL